jgi:pyruvate/2-oxoglutarate dehydrogenase complex dihydrolipoamide acyltransferase (E2) component
MAQKKKPSATASEANASAEALPTNNTLAAASHGNNQDHVEDPEVEDLADRDLEVDLHDLGLSSEDIQAIKRIDSRLAERQQQAQQAQAQAGPSNGPPPAGAKGKGIQLTPEEMEEKLNKLKEQELRCKAMRRAIRDRLLVMKPPRQDPKTAQQAPVSQVHQPYNQVPVNEDQYSDQEEGEYFVQN